MERRKKKATAKMENSTSRREMEMPMPMPMLQVQEKSAGRSIGCMSGIFQFLARHHRSHKRLPSAGRKKKNAKETPQHPELSKPTLIPDKAFRLKQIGRHSSEVQRSPTLPSDIRGSSVEISQLDSPRRPTPLVVRLMGLDGVPATSPSPKIDNNEADQKRRKLLGALEKCDEDLKSLKRIIDAVRAANAGSDEAKVVGKFMAAGSDMEPDAESSLEASKSGDGSTNGEQQPSPVSVLDTISSPKYRSKGSDNETREGPPTAAIQLRAPKPSVPRISGSYDKNDEEAMDCRASISHPITIEGLRRTSKRKGVEVLEELGRAKRVIKGDYPRRRRRSNELVENVGEVCEDGAWEQRRELGRIGAGLARGVLGDLVEEFVRELLGVNFKGLFFTRE